MKTTDQISQEYFEPTPQELAEVDIDQLRELRSLTRTERLIRHESSFQLVMALREAGIRRYGFDPATIAQAVNESG